MNFNFTEEQEMLKAAFAEFVKEESASLLTHTVKA